MDELVSGFLVGEAAFELFGLDGAQEASDLGTVAEVKVADEIVSVDERFGDERLTRKLFFFGTNEIVIVAKAVRAVAIDAVEFHFQLEGFRGHEALELGGAHLLDVHELHVPRDHEAHVGDRFVGVAEAPEDVFGHFGTHLVVSVEAEAFTFLVPGLGGGLADVVQEDGEGQGQGGIVEQGEGEAGVDVDVALGVPLGRLFAAAEVEDLGQEAGDEARIDEEVEAPGALRGHEDAGKFIADAFRGNLSEKISMRDDGSPRFLLDLKAGDHRKANGAQEAEGVFLKASGRVADGTQDAVLQIGPAVDVVDDLAGDWILKKSVDGEVAALGVFFRSGKSDRLRASSVLVGAIGAEGGDFDHFAVAFHDDDPEVGAHRIGFREEGADFVRGGRGGEVVVFGLLIEELVTDTASREIHPMPGLTEGPGGVEGQLFLGGHGCGASLSRSGREAIIEWRVVRDGWANLGLWRALRVLPWRQGPFHPIVSFMAFLNYHHLRYFRAIATEGTLTGAAAKLGVAQSALSVQLKQLEESIGQLLFHRQNKSLVLTEAGRIALDYAETIFRSGEEMMSVLQNRPTSRRKVFRVGSVATLSRNFQLSCLRPFIGRDDVELVLRSGSLRELLAQLQSHTLDVVLSNLPVRREADTPWHSHLLEEQPVSLVGKKCRGRKALRFPEDLEREPLLLPSLDSQLRASFDLVLEREGIIPMIAAEVDDMAMLRLLAREGAGLALVPPVVVEGELKRGILTELYRFKDLSESFYAITPSRRYPNELVGEMLGRKNED